MNKKKECDKRTENSLTVGIILAGILQDLNMGRDLLAITNLAGLLVNKVCNEFVPPTGLSVHQYLASSQFW